MCRVHKRAGVEDHPSLPGSSTSRRGPSNTANKKHYNLEIMGRQLQALNNSLDNDNSNSIEKMNETDGSCSSSDVSIALGLPTHDNAAYCTPVELHEGITLLQPQLSKNNLTSASYSSLGCSPAPFSMDELHSVVNYQQKQQLPEHTSLQQSYLHQSAESTQMMISTNRLNNHKNSIGELQAATNFSDSHWTWNPVPDGNRLSSDQFASHFK